jgi:hypothetical protein
LRLTGKRISNFLFVIQGVGIVFVGIFLAAYLGGLPTTVVLHSEPVFRIPLFIFGAVLLVLLMSALVVLGISKKVN